MAAERVRQYGAQIKLLKQQLKELRAKGKKGAADTLDDLESRVELNKGCMQEELQMQASKAWHSVDYLRFGLPAAKSMVFTAGRCSNHALRALDDVGEVSLTLSGQALDRMLTPYGQSLIFETASVPEPSNVFEQVLHGKIGSAAITVFLTSISYDAYGTGERSVSGLYFYDKYRKPIILSGKQVGQTISLHEGGDITRAAITLQPGRTGLSGKWEADNKTLPMTLVVGR
jgi:hypothetical protein